MQQVPGARGSFGAYAPLIGGVVLGLLASACSKKPAATFEVVEPPAPRIESITHGAPGGARPGETVSITLKGDSGLKATASLGTLAPSLALEEDSGEGGLYRGSLVIPEGKQGSYDLTGRLEADGRFSTQAGPSLSVVAPPPPPEPPKRSLTAADFNAQRVLRTIHFAFNRFDLQPESLETLGQNAIWLRQNPEFRLLIEGHCDERGTNEHNLALGDKRANAARDYLVNAGIAAGRIRTISYGEERPADPGHKEEAWAKNRRAEFVLED